LLAWCFAACRLLPACLTLLLLLRRRLIVVAARSGAIYEAVTRPGKQRHDSTSSNGTQADRQTGKQAGKAEKASLHPSIHPSIHPDFRISIAQPD
jgi:hypothetical protein